MVLLFITPFAIKFVDTFTHQHKHIYCVSKTSKHYHENHEECNVLGVSFSSFTTKTPCFVSKKTSKYILFYSNEYISFKKEFQQKSFSLRAPPILIS